MRSEKAIISTTFPVLMSAKKQAGTITQANLIIFTEPLTATYFFQNINTEKFTKQYREFTHTQESFQVLTACRTFSFEANENLHYYTFAFSEDGKRCKNYLKIRQDNAPTENEYSTSEIYHAKNTLRKDELNLRFEEEDFFVEELAYAVRVIFINIIRENERESIP